jgi:site-specific recombinase XerD
MTIQIVHTGERIPLEELLASLREPLVLEYLMQLRLAGFAEKTLRTKRTIVAAFLRWARNHQVPFSELATADLEAFLGGRRPGRNSRWRHARGILFRFLAFLHPDGPRPGSLDHHEDSSRTGLLARYQDFLVNERGLTKQTVYIYTPLVRTAIAGLSRLSDSQLPCDWNAEAVHAFLLEQSHYRSSVGMGLVASTLRSLLRFLYLRGEVAFDLSRGVSRFRQWKLATVPTYLSPVDVEKVLAACDMATPTGRRDRAIVLLLARLGLRAGEVVTLEVGDIAWRSGEILVRGKGQQRDHLPLPPDVGEAMALYLRLDRGESVSRRVFLRLIAPREGLTGPASVGHIVRKLFARAGIIRTSRGAAHMFRHSLATRMIRHGASISEIAEVLRHRSQNTTGIYAKVAFQTLREVARPWPGEGSCQ